MSLFSRLFKNDKATESDILNFGLSQAMKFGEHWLNNSRKNIGLS
mgnify:CR=1 FL=1